VGTTFVFGALVTVGFFTGAAGAGRAVDVIGAGGGASCAVKFEGAGRVVDDFGASGGACCAVNLLGPGSADPKAVDLGFDFWIAAACAGGAGWGVLGRVARGIGGGTGFEGPATGGIGEAAPLLSFWFSKKTASALRCAPTNSRLSTIPFFIANL
jgi:hypothetical protein